MKREHVAVSQKNVKGICFPVNSKGFFLSAKPAGISSQMTKCAFRGAG